ncbi:MAG: helix-turn-helix domain-containing protein [Desulfovibrio sp.]|uniref:helix-turn-helix domain-containing protein n=1 Tax=Desulfovibrio sp. 7SRBS1 TaxID=3378064 RepID=UPI003B403809
MSRKDFANLVGSHENTIGNYERDDRTPDIVFVSNVCKKTGASLDWLILGKEPVLESDKNPQHAGIISKNVDEAESRLQQALCRCSRLEDELHNERQLSRDIVAENRQLWKENSMLREKYARLEAVKKQA